MRNVSRTGRSKSLNGNKKENNALASVGNRTLRESSR